MRRSSKSKRESLPSLRLLPPSGDLAFSECGKLRGAPRPGRFSTAGFRRRSLVFKYLNVTEMSRYKTITVTVIPAITQVRIYEETVAHVREQHPEIPVELPSILYALEETIRNPTHIELSRPNSYVFVNFFATNKSGDPLRAPVKIIEGTSARVKTFYFASTTSAANIIWRREGGT